MKTEKTQSEKELRETIEILENRLYWTYCGAMTLLGKKIISYDGYCRGIDEAIKKSGH